MLSVASAPCRSVLASVLLTVAAVAMVACGSSGDSESASGAQRAVPVPVAPGTVEEPRLPVTVTDAEGRSVTIEDTSRIVALSGNLAETVYALGLGDDVVGRDISTTIEEAQDVPLVTRAHDVSAESVLSLEPTVVLADTNTGPPEALEHIRNVGVPVVTFEVTASVEGVSEQIERVGEALGVPGTGAEVAERTEAEIDAVASDGATDSGAAAGGARDDAPLVAFLYMRGQAGVYLIGGEGSGADSMIEAAGGRDAGTAIGLDQPFTPITSEALVKAAPDVILMTTTGLESVGGVAGLVEIPGIAQTPAGRAGSVVTIEDGLLFGFGTRTPSAIEQIAEGFAAFSDTKAGRG
ncbi:MAG: ABC transporter substrate-binding protein [Microthrixaceae bacterium]